MASEQFYLNFPNVGFVGYSLSQLEVQPIKDEIDTITRAFADAKKISHAHAGNIKQEYELIDSVPTILSLITPLAVQYQQVFNFGSTDKNKFKLTTAWVNFQKKHEFFASHTHKGMFSFALWIQVPYLISEEMAYCSTPDKHTDTPATFNFQYTDALGTIQPWTIPVDRTFENKMILFPGRMNHTVHPFYTSDEYRIVVSGNIEYED